jgi:hypothetical protein
MDHLNFLPALESWCKERETYPSRLDVRLAHTLRARMKIHVEVQPQKHSIPTTTDTPLRLSRHVLIDETLTASTADRLTTTLRAIQKHQGLEFQQGLCYMTLISLVSCDLERTQAGNTSLLFTNGDAQREEHRQDAIPPVWSLDDVLQFWERCDGRLNRGFPPPGNRAKGQWSYRTIPPIWFPDQLSMKMAREPFADELLFSHAPPPPTVSISVPAPLQGFMENLVTLLQTVPHSVRLDLSLRVVAAEGEGIQTPELSHIKVTDATQAQEKDQTILRVSPDGRSVNLRGEVFTFTPTQARVFEILYDAYKNGTPEISETHIIHILGYEKGKVKDVFKRHANWQKLIVKGERKDTFRLNIDL